MWLSALSLLLILVGCTWSAINNGVRDKYSSFMFLNKYGYNPCSNSSRKVSCSVDQSSMLRVYQKQHGLKITGILDLSTIRQMNRPRCGNADVRVARMGDHKWSRSSLTWSLRSHPRQLSRERATAIMREAFNTWSVHIPLEIKEACSTCSADFVIETGGYNHNCNGGSFDGPNGVLAHAFFPVDGRIHFDSDEPWTEASNDAGINFYSVAVHEIGHALGLDHNDNQHSIMFPSYIPSLDVRTLPDVDRHSIQTMYGTSNDGGNKPRKPDGGGDGGSIDWRGNNWANGCDFSGNDLSHVRVRADQCGPQCDSTEGCTHFVWTKWNGGTCYMKTGSVSKSDAIASHDRSMVCGVASGEETHDHGINWRGNNWAHGCDFNGNDLSHVRVRAEQCGPECESTEGCTHFVWTKQNGGTCYMKTGSVSKSDAIARRDQSRVCGVAN